MKRYLLAALTGFVLRLICSTEGWSLSSCSGSPASGVNVDPSKWDGCRDTYTHADGRMGVSIWENRKSLCARKLSPTVTAMQLPELIIEVLRDLNLV